MERRLRARDATIVSKKLFDVLCKEQDTDSPVLHGKPCVLYDKNYDLNKKKWQEKHGRRY